MATTVTLNAIRSRICNFVTPDDVIDREYLATMYQKDQALVEFSAVPDSYKYKIATGARAYMYEMATDTEEGHWKSITGYGIEGGPFPDSVTYNTKPSRALYSFGSAPMIEGSMAWEKTLTCVTWPYSKYADYISKSVELITKNGASFSIGHPIEDHGIAYIYLMGSGYEPYLEIDFSDDDSYLKVSGASPSSGYIPKAGTNTFTWSTEKSYGCYGDISVTDAKIRYKQSDSGTETEIDCGTSSSHTFAENTFSSDSVLWQIEITDSTGHTYTSDWYTLSTVEVLSTAETISPKSTVVDGSIDNVFQWTHIIETGTAQSSAQIQVSTDGSTWGSLVTVQGTNQYVTISAGSLTAGNCYWRVRTANTEGNYGEWSDAANIVVVAAPTAPSVSVEQTPRPLISWQSSGQQGYEVSLLQAGEEVYTTGTLYGTDVSHKLTRILADGQYTARVRIQNSYSLWSEYGTANLAVENSAYSEIELTVTSTGAFATLSWSTDGDFSRYLVYRNGQPIALTESTSYSDIRSIGENTYYIIGMVSDSDNYSKSNICKTTIKPSTVVAITEEGVIQMRTSDVQLREISTSKSRDVSRYYIYGANYPIEESAKEDKRIMSFSTAFSDRSEADTFEELFGKEVVIKTPACDMITGTLTSMSRTSNCFYTKYTCSIYQTHCDEVVDL